MRKYLLFLIALRMAGCHPLPAAEVTLEWNPNPESNIAGYIIDVSGGAGGATTINTGKVTRHTVTNLEAGRTYSFTLSAKNTAGLVSNKTAPVTYTVPLNSVRLTVQQSTDLVNWTEVTGTLPITQPLQDKRFYRMKIEIIPTP